MTGYKNHTARDSKNLPEVVIVSISSVIAGIVGLNWEFIGAVLMGVFWGVGAVTFLFLISTKTKTCLIPYIVTSSRICKPHCHLDLPACWSIKKCSEESKKKKKEKDEINPNLPQGKKKFCDWFFKWRKETTPNKNQPSVFPNLKTGGQKETSQKTVKRSHGCFLLLKVHETIHITRLHLVLSLWVS